TNFPNGITSFGVPILGSVGGSPVAGTVFWVNSATGLDATGLGTDTGSPFKTLAFAVSQAKADHGDVIMLMPGHSETITAAVTLANAGIRIVGMGEGVKRPGFTFNTSTAASFIIGAANVRFENIRFVCDLASTVVCLDFSGFAGGRVYGCDFYAN